MSDMSDSSSHKARSLRDTIRKVRTAETERSDVVVELRDAERARLELLADELRTVFEEVPPDDEQFIFSVSPGSPARLWIDMTSFVVMGRDRRTYRFLKDTRLGRTVLLETGRLDDMADTITHYVAERIIERERAMEGDWLMKRVLSDGQAQPRETPSMRGRLHARSLPAPDTGAEAVSAPARVADSRLLGWVVAAFLGGILLGVIALFGYAWMAVG